MMKTFAAATLAAVILAATLTIYHTQGREPTVYSFEKPETLDAYVEHLERNGFFDGNSSIAGAEWSY